MKPLLIFAISLWLQIGYGQVVLNADGPGETYELITSVLAPGYNPIEVPDCNHIEFGRHIDEVFDDELNKYVFRFHIHTDPDNDRCLNFDRQRNEIKSYNQSPDNLVGVQNEKVVYKWKFKLPTGFQSSPNFTHLHQLKSVGGPYASLPIYSILARKGSPDKLELRYAETDDSDVLKQTDLAPFIDTWLDVTETIKYGTSGTYELEIKKVSDDTVLFEYANASIVNWRPDADIVRPKWGIYRSLLNAQDLRDETVLFADFSVDEIETSSTEKIGELNKPKVTFSNPIRNTIYIKDITEQIKFIKIYSLDGSIVLDETINSQSALVLDVGSLPKGIFVINFIGTQFNQSEFILMY